MAAALRPYQLPTRQSCGHRVQFYDTEEHLYDVLSDYFAPFFLDGEGWLTAIVLARAPTTKYLSDRLLGRGYTRDRTAGTCGRRWKGCVDECATPLGTVYGDGHRSVFLFDADMTLTRLVQGGELCLGEFDIMLRELISQLLPEQATTSRQDYYQETPIYAYGELVDILCARGQHLLALELESFWNRFLADENMSLLCGYKMESFRDLEVDNVFDQICHSHAAVTPTETYSNLSSVEEKHTMIATLQAKAKAIKLQQTQLLHWSHGKDEQRIRCREQSVDELCHELRNPVSGIVGNIELLQGGLDVRQAILRPHQGDSKEKNVRLSNTDVLLLQDQLAGDVISVDAIAVCAEHMKTISDNVLSVSKLEEGKVGLEQVPFDPKSTIISVMKMFSTMAHKKRIQIHQDIPAERFLVIGDPGRLAQVIINLVSNAVKFTNTGSITVQLRSIGCSSIKGHLSTFRVTVRDTGRGLSQDEISTLFQRFAQPRSTSFAKDGGTGLGLYISKSLVELMGGTISVESEHGEGSTFIFTFLARNFSPPEVEIPRELLTRVSEHEYSGFSIASSCHGTDAQPSAVAISYDSTLNPVASDTSECSSSFALSLASSALTISTSPLTQHHRPVRHVLVVDDNFIIRKTLRRLLESALIPALIVSTASNGYEAISKLIDLYTSTSPIDLIFMDLDMPFMDGLRATDEIRLLISNNSKEDLSAAEDGKARQLAEVAIIGMTGDIRDERFLEARHHGMDECIQKPVVKSVLLEHVHQTARRRQHSTG